MDRQSFGILSGSLVLLSKPNAKGECVIYLRYYLGKYVKNSTEIMVPAEDWDESKQCVKKSNRNAARLNNELHAIKARVDEKLLSYRGNITLGVLNAALGKATEDSSVKTLEPRHQEFIKFAHEVNNLYYSKKQYGYTSWYNKDKSIDAFAWFVARFDKSGTLFLDNLNVDVFNRYIAYRFNDRKNTSRQGVNKTLVPLYEAIKYAASIGILSNDEVAPIVNNFVPIRDTEYKSEDEMDETIKYLTVEQIHIQPRMKTPRTRD